MSARAARGMPDLLAVALGLAASLAGCTVARPDPNASIYRCGATPDCLPGFACVDRTPLGEPGYCVPACDPAHARETCPDGVCTSQGACLDGCIVVLDGTVTEGCPPGLSCVRTDSLRDEGVCYAIESCSVGSDCASSPGAPPRACIGDALGIPTSVPGLDIASNRLFCVDAPEGPRADRCAAGSVLLDAATPVCMPTCGEAGERCPPATTCLAGLGWFFGASGSSVCFVGAWGAPCEDDTQCLFGRCLDVGGRRVCTERCDDVPTLPGPDGCAGIEDSTFYGSFTARCEEVAGESVCVPRGEIGTPCGASLPCIDALQCLLVRGESTGVCSRGCSTDPDCWLAEVPAHRRQSAYCEPTIGACLPRRRIGAPCLRDGQCLTGHCRLDLCTER